MSLLSRFRAWAGRELALWLASTSAAFAAIGFSVVLLHPKLADVRTIGLIVVATFLLGIGSRWAPRRLHDVPFLAIITLLAVGTIGIATSGVASTFTGIFTVLFCFVGLTRPRGTGLKLLVVAVPCWLLDSTPIGVTTLARLPVAVGCWVLVSELIARYRHQQEEVQSDLEEQLMHDALTGLTSRRGLETALDSLQDGDTVVFLDLDHFKHVNDNLGHAAGDEVLGQFGRAVGMVIGSRDTAIRYGGEEILILLEQTTVGGAEGTLTRLRDVWRTIQPAVTFSAGVARVRSGLAADALRRADDALYRAKAAGRNCWVTAEATEPPAGPPHADEIHPARFALPVPREADRLAGARSAGTAAGTPGREAAELGSQV